MNDNFSYVEDLTASVAIAPDSIVSHTLHADEKVKSIVFGFDTGQELSEHTAPVPAILHVLQGEAEITLGGESRRAKAGAWAWMPAHLPHSIKATTPLVMLLTMLKRDKSSD
jgi:quercetin dioxygenase-like cupin family protein